MPTKRKVSKKPSEIFRKGIHNYKVEIPRLKHSKEIIFTEWFKKFISRNPNLIRNFLEARKQIINRSLASKVGNVTVELSHGLPKSQSRYYKVTIGKIKFFIKEHEYHTTHGGKRQFENMERARRIIKTSRQEMVTHHFVWEQNNHTFLVMGYYNLPTLEQMEKINNKKYRQLQKKLWKIQDRLAKIGIFDVEEHNCFYDKKRDKLIFFDLID